MLKRISELVVRFPWLFIILFVGTTIGIGSFLRNASIDPELKNQLPPDFPTRVSMDRIEDIFGGTEMVMVILEADDVLAPETLKRTKKISRKMNRLGEIDRVLSLFELKDIRGEAGEMLVDPAVKRIPRTDDEREALRRILKANDLVYGSVVSEDFRAVAVIGMLGPGATDADALTAVREILAETPGEEPVSLAGMPFVRENVSHDIRGDMRKFLPIGLVVIMVFLYLCFRQARGMFLPFIVVVMSVAVSMGLIPLIGWKIQIVTIILPVMMMAIANDYGIHLIAKYQEDNYPGNPYTKEELARRMIMDLGAPVLATAVTTIGGMLCLRSHVVVPAKQLAILASIGIAYAFFGSILFIPAVVALLPKAKPIVDLKNDTGRRSWLDNGLFFLARGVSQRPKGVLIATIVIVAVVATGIRLIDVDANPVNYYKSDHPVARSATLVNDYFGGNSSLSVVAKGDIKDPAVLREVDELERTLEFHPNVGNTISLARVVRRMNRVMNDDDPAFDRIPDTREEIAQYLLLYSMNGDPDDFDRMIDFPYENAHIQARINTLNTAKIAETVAFTKDYIDGLPDSPFTMVSGFAAFFDALVDAVINGQLLSLTLSLLVICVLVAILFRSAMAGILASLTVGLAMVILFGLMGFLKIKLNLATAMLSSIMIGVGVDYTIHYLWRYRKERRRGKAPAEAVAETLTTVGRGIVFNALSVVVGFAVLITSTFLPVQFFGFLVVVSITSCLVGALVLLPAVSLVFRPKFLEPRTEIE